MSLPAFQAGRNCSLFHQGIGLTASALGWILVARRATKERPLFYIEEGLVNPRFRGYKRHPDAQNARHDW